MINMLRKFVVIEREEQSMSDDNKEVRRRQLPTYMSLVLRGFAGVYLVYSAWQLFKQQDQADPGIFVLICFVLFVAVGIFLIIWTASSYFKGEFVGGKADILEEVPGEDGAAADSKETIVTEKKKKE